MRNVDNTQKLLIKNFSYMLNQFLLGKGELQIIVSISKVKEKKTAKKVEKKKTEKEIKK